MKNIIKLEEMAMLVISIFVLLQFNVPWWVYLILFLGPDISMLGYLAGKGIGAFCYNLVHHKGIALGIVVAGYAIDHTNLLLAGVILFGHSSMDRMFGYGLKYTRGFKFTHLGGIGKETD